MQLKTFFLFVLLASFSLQLVSGASVGETLSEKAYFPMNSSFKSASRTWDTVSGLNLTVNGLLLNASPSGYFDDNSSTAYLNGSVLSFFDVGSTQSGFIQVATNYSGLVQQDWLAQASGTNNRTALGSDATNANFAICFYTGSFHCSSVAVANISNGACHTISWTYNAATTTAQGYLDGVPMSGTAPTVSTSSTATHDVFVKNDVSLPAQDLIIYRIGYSGNTWSAANMSSLHSEGCPYVPVSNSCTYSGSGNWDVLGSDACTLSSNTALSSGSMTCSGSGSTSVTAAITAFTGFVASGSTTVTVSGGGRLG